MAIQFKPSHVAQLVGHLIQEPEVPGSIPGLVTYGTFVSPSTGSKGSCQLLAKVCA